MSNFIEQTLVEYLFRFPTVKDYFLQFKIEEWAQVLSSTLIYGIQAIEATHHKFLSMPDLNDRLKRVSSVKAVEESIPNLKTKLNSLKKEIFDLETKLEPRVHSKTPIESQESVEEVAYPMKTKPKMVDFWYQTDLRKKSSRNEVKNSPKTKPWVHDYSKVVKGQKTYLNYEDLEN